MGRCMGDAVMRREYPEQDQRAAVCHSQWDHRKEQAMNEPKDFSRIPAAACVLTVGEFELGDNGEGAKSAPVRLRCAKWQANRSLVLGAHRAATCRNAPA